jgi:hypothetical protein
VLVLTRYRALIPFLFVVLLLEHVGRRVVLLWKPITRAGGTANLMMNGLILPALLIAGLVLALWERKRRAVVAA